MAGSQGLDKRLRVCIGEAPASTCQSYGQFFSWLLGLDTGASFCYTCYMMEYNPVIDGYDQCVLCNDNLMDMGHNPYPLSNEGRACEYCNMVHVIPARIAEMNTIEEKINGVE